MNRWQTLAIAPALALATLLAGCASTSPRYVDERGYEICERCGTVERIVRVYGEGGSTGGGAVAGAIIGGILGNQVGKGSGRDAATVVGAIAGGVAGNEIEKDVRSAPRYEITVRMENGRRLVYTQRDSFGLRDGDYVRAEGNQVVPYR
ncbi:MAG: glycine zipper 2TM domain-containing protein [Xanthomonadales bacterium]|nr:glycine zipper 2TM domain-containing protein [Xanthomonadales bacterium]MCB1634405.1 glycine zipper 2TM domain-containing protein [Xanthomonadales bacterium]